MATHVAGHGIKVVVVQPPNAPRSLRLLALYATLLVAACASSGQDVETPRTSTWSNLITRGLRPVFYIDDQRANFTWLGSLHTDRIEEIRFLHGRDATTLWGTNHPGGVVHVITRDRPR